LSALVAATEAISPLLFKTFHRDRPIEPLTVLTDRLCR